MAKRYESIQVMLSASHRRSIGRAAAAAKPMEACGLLIGTRRTGQAKIEAIIVLENYSRRDRHSYYEIDPVDFLRVENEAHARNRDVIGAWHSHPHGPILPSATDRDLAWPDWCYLIAGLRDDGTMQLGAWRFVDNRMIEDQLSQ